MFVVLRTPQTIGRQDRNSVILSNTQLAQRIGSLPAAPPHFAIGDDALAINDRRFPRIDSAERSRKGMGERGS
jgi:hypothetical protein